MQSFHQAKINNDVEVVVWRTGNAMREFLYVDYMAQALLGYQPKYMISEGMDESMD